MDRIEKMLKDEKRDNELATFKAARKKLEDLLKTRSYIKPQEMPLELRQEYLSNESKVNTAGFISHSQRMKDLDEAGERLIQERARQGARL